MIYIIMALSLTVTPQLEAKAQLAFNSGLCVTTLNRDDARKVSNALSKDATGISEFEAGYLSAAFEAGINKSLEFKLNRQECRYLFKEILSAK